MTDLSNIEQTLRSINRELESINIELNNIKDSSKEINETLNDSEAYQRSLLDSQNLQYVKEIYNLLRLVIWIGIIAGIVAICSM